MLIEQGHWHSQKLLLYRIAVSNHATSKNVRGAWHRRKGSTKRTTSTGFSNSQSLPSLPKQSQHHRRQSVVITSVTEPSCALEQLLLHGMQQRLRLAR